MKIDMSPEAVTNRMRALDQLWELAVALRSSKIERYPDEVRKENKKVDSSTNTDVPKELGTAL